MYFQTNIITPPTQLAVDLDLCRRAARIDQVNDMDLLQLYIQTATDIAERYLNRSLVTKTYELVYFDAKPNNKFSPYINPEIINLPLEFSYLQYFSGNYVELLYSPIQTVQSVTIGQWGQSDVTLEEGTNYFVDSSTTPGRIKILHNAPFSTFRHDHTTITYTAGYGQKNAIPASIKTAILQMTLRLWEHRGDEVDDAQLLSGYPKNSLDMYRVFRWF
jgi:hypothetical protein